MRCSQGHMAAVVMVVEAEVGWQKSWAKSWQSRKAGWLRRGITLQGGRLVKQRCGTQKGRGKYHQDGKCLLQSEDCQSHVGKIAGQ